MFNQYADFEIEISGLNQDRYTVSVNGPGGDAKRALVLPTNDPIYQALAERLQHLDADEESLATQ